MKMSFELTEDDNDSGFVFVPEESLILSKIRELVQRGRRSRVLLPMDVLAQIEELLEKHSGRHSRSILMADEVFRTQLMGLLTAWKSRGLILGFSCGLCTVTGPCSLKAMSATEVQFSLTGAGGVTSEVMISLKRITEFSVGPYEQVAHGILQTTPWERTEEQLGMFSNNSVREIAEIRFEHDARLLLGVLDESADCGTATRPWREVSHSRTVV